MKKTFEKPELQVVYLNTQDAFIATSGCVVDNDDCPIEGEFIHW